MEKEDIIILLIGGIGWILLGAGFYGIFATDEPFHPMLKSKEFIFVSVALGILLSIIEARHFIMKAINRARDKHEGEDQA